MLLAGSALGASPPQNLCSLASVPFGGIVIRHGPYPPPPFVETKNQLRPLPQMPRHFSFLAPNVIDPLANPVFGDDLVVAVPTAWFRLCFRKFGVQVFPVA